VEVRSSTKLTTDDVERNHFDQAREGYGLKEARKLKSRRTLNYASSSSYVTLVNRSSFLFLQAVVNQKIRSAMTLSSNKGSAETAIRKLGRFLPSPSEKEHHHAYVHIHIGQTPLLAFANFICPDTEKGSAHLHFHPFPPFSKSAHHPILLNLHS
jgi:hypothetical protein